MFKLVIEDDEGNKTVVPVIRDEITIGRQEGNTIRLTERNVSRKHAKLSKVEEEIFVEELAARYGTKKNGEKISGRAPFSLGDVVFIGDYRLTLEGEGVETKPTKPAPPAAAALAPLPAPMVKPSGGFSSQPTAITRREDIERGQGTEVLPAMPAKLIVVSSNFAGQEFPLNRKEVVIGRADECDIIIDHRSVSQTHAKVVREPSGVYKIVDLNSKNGVKVSGEEYRAVHLKRGDVVELGHVRFRFVEPGENYVFTPQATSDFDSYDDVPLKKNNTPMIIGGAVIVLVLVIGLVFAFTGGEDTSAPDEIAENPKTKPDKPDPEIEVPSDSKLGPQLEKAEQELAQGRPERAIAVLEMARDMLEPNASERQTIDDLLSEARRERPLEEKFDDGKDDHKDGKYVDALKKYKEIPPEPPSKIYALMMKEEHPQKAIDQILGAAMTAMEEGNKTEAGRLIGEVLLYDAEDSDALSMKEELKSIKDKPVAVANTTKKVKKPRPPKAKKLTAEEASDRLKASKKALIKGDWNEAIRLCKPVRNGGCYRSMGVAYQKLDKDKKSCAYFAKSGGKTPPHCE